MNKNKPNVRITGDGSIFNQGNFFAAGENGTEITAHIYNRETGIAEFGDTEIGEGGSIVNEGKLKTGKLKINIKLEHWLSKHPWWNMLLSGIIGVIISEVYSWFIQIS